MIVGEKYRILKDREIGSGSSSRVYLARDIASGEEFACKIQVLDNIEDWKYGLAELETWKLIEGCENIVKLVDSYVDKDKKTIYLIMEVMKETLEEYIEKQMKDGSMIWNNEEDKNVQSKGRLMESESMYYFYQLLLGLNHMHQRGVIHRDIKPANLFLKGQKLLIGDFNLSCSGELAVTKVGTPKYMCPLMVIEKSYSKYVDIWSSGLILFRMIYGFDLYDYVQLNEKPSTWEEYVAKIGQKITEEGLILPVKPKVSEKVKVILKKILNMTTIKEVKLEELLEESCFRKYRDELRKEKVSLDKGYIRRKTVIGESVKVDANSIRKGVHYLMSDDKELNVALEEYKNIMYSERMKVFYLDKIVETCEDLLEYYMKMKESHVQEYKKIKENVKKHIFMLLLLKKFIIDVLQELEATSTDLHRYNKIYEEVYGKNKPKLGLKDWRDMKERKGSEADEVVANVRKEVEDRKAEFEKNVQMTEVNFEGLLTDDRMKMLEAGGADVNVMRKVEEEAREEVRRCGAREGVEGEIVKRIGVLVYYYFKYHTTHVFDWRKLHARVLFLDDAKTDDVLNSFVSVPPPTAAHSTSDASHEQLAPEQEQHQPGKVNWRLLFIFVIVAVVTYLIGISNL